MDREGSAWSAPGLALPLPIIPTPAPHAMNRLWEASWLRMPPASQHAPHDCDDSGGLEGGGVPVGVLLPGTLALQWHLQRRCGAEQLLEGRQERRGKEPGRELRERRLGCSRLDWDSAMAPRDSRHCRPAGAFSCQSLPHASQRGPFKCSNVLGSPSKPLRSPQPAPARGRPPTALQVVGGWCNDGSAMHMRQRTAYGHECSS